MSIKENLQIINDRIKSASIKCGRNESAVKLMAVSKFHPVDEILEACKNNQFLFGENRVQEAGEKFPQIYKQFPDTDLHIIGSLQTNKVKNAVKICSCIQSVDRFDLIKEIEKQCNKIDKVINILFELHTGEESKSGFTNDEQIIECLEYLIQNKVTTVNPIGFMTMAPFTDDEKLIRKSFISCRDTKDKIQKQFPEYKLDTLSMGMSGDFEIAIQEGSTLVRVGTAIFGERNYNK